MATIVVEGIPDGLLARLRLAAGDSGRTLSREVVVQLARAVDCAREAPAAFGARTGIPCVARDCGCAARRVEAGVVGWGGPAR